MKKKLLPLTITLLITAAAVFPLGIQHAEAVSYEPTYTCYYRDIAGSCLNYQTSNPYHQTQASYGNRKSYPFNTMFSATTTTQSPWDNRYSNLTNNYRYKNYRYEEEDDDDNDYIDDDDDYYDRYHHTYDTRDGQWLNYYDEDDDRIRSYKFQSDDYYQNNENWFNKNDGAYFEFEYTKSYCTGSDCRSYNRY